MSILSNKINEIETKGFKSMGDEIRQQLKRYRLWRNLQAQNPGLKLYSLRHGVAYRMHKSCNGPSLIRDAAARVNTSTRSKSCELL
ncbi:hypothetical protein [Synechococcus sp. M16CYN]|uniref:hypothetical protein n=1 Tax=Synechococcus sp. M16CYN TaxID=3103139 RepID=UPI00334188D2